VNREWAKCRRITGCDFSNSYTFVMAGPLSRPPMKTVPAMVPRNAFIAAYMMSNRKYGMLYVDVTIPIGTATWRSSHDAVFMDGRDNGPAMTRFAVLSTPAHYR
jgi:hypothetical protein